MWRRRSEEGLAIPWRSYWSPYERLLKQVEKLADEHADDERKLGKALKKLVDVVRTA